MPTVSTIATVLLVVPLITVALAARGTLQGSGSRLRSDVRLAFTGFAVMAFIVAGLMSIADALSGMNLHFTWFAPATSTLYLFGFFGMVIFGAAYSILPQIFGANLPSPKLVRLHFWLFAIGVLLTVIPLAAGGVVEAFKLADANKPFLDITRATLLFLRISTLGELLIVLGNALFLVNLTGLVARYYRARVSNAYKAATSELSTTADLSPNATRS
jgi:cytochrome c oxidase cbb3-type subunit I